MTPILHLRSFSNDQYILDKVFYSNFYRIKAFQETDKKPVVLDIGAHCGYFSFAVMALGAKKVYAIEPFTPNYKMLLKNVGDEPLGHNVPIVTYQKGVYVSPICVTFGHPKIEKGSFYDFSNVGYDSNASSSEFCKCSLIPLDDLLENYIGEQVDIMKISVGYGEMAILEHSKLLSERVHNICGEISVDDNGKLKLKSLLSSKGFVDTEFYPVDGEENKLMFHSSKTDRREVFVCQ